MRKTVLLSILILSSTISFCQDISGTWYWEYDGKHVSEIILTQEDINSFKGYYCSSYSEGKKIDCSDSTQICINVDRINENEFQGTFESPSFSGSGEIRILYLPSISKIKIEILNSQGEFYLPNNGLFN